jgi:signal transduction histidine kinase
MPGNTFEEVLQQKDENLKSHIIALYRDSVVGRLVSGFTHEVNNPLAILQGNVELLERSLGAAGVDDEKVIQRLDRITKSVGRIELLIRDFRKVVKAKDEPEEILNIDDVINGMTPALTAIIGKDGTEMVFETKSPQAKVVGSEVEFHTAFLSMVMAAKDVASRVRKPIEIATSVNGKDLILSIVCNRVAAAEGSEQVPSSCQFDTYIGHSAIERLGGMLDLNLTEEGLDAKVVLPLASE